MGIGSWLGSGGADARGVIIFKMPRKRQASAVQRASVETSFIVALKRRLPREALEELRHLSPKDAGNWAKRWNLNARCVIDEAEKIADAGLDDTADTLIDCVINDNDTTLWAQELGRLDALPRSVMRQTINERVAARLVAGYRKDHLINDKEALAPLSANPLHETQEHFLNRAREHYEARLKNLERTAKKERFVLEHPRSSPELERHIEWLLAFQIANRTYAQIACSAGLDPGAAP